MQSLNTASGGWYFLRSQEYLAIHSATSLSLRFSIEKGPHVDLPQQWAPHVHARELHSRDIKSQRAPKRETPYRVEQSEGAD